MQGLKSEATKRRQKLIADGVIPAPTKDRRKAMGAIKALIARGHVAAVGAPVRIVRNDALEQRIGHAAVVPCLERIIAIATGQVERTPIATQMQAGQWVVDRYGKAKDGGGEDTPLNELTAPALLDALRALGNEAAKRSAEDAEVLPSDQQSAAPPVESKP